MILTCSSCGTRYAVDAAKLPAAGRVVRCAKCGHTWHQAAQTAAEPESEAQIPPQGFGAQSVATAEPGLSSPDSASQRFTRASRPREPIGPVLAVAAGWAALIVLVLLIIAGAVRYREDIAAIWPQSAGVYARLGVPVATSGIDFRQVDYHRESQDGQVVLAVSGKIVNAGSRELPVPQSVRVTLSDANNRELYHWTFKPNATLLAPGQSVVFLTRLSSPPAAARHLELRFAKDPS